MFIDTSKAFFSHFHIRMSQQTGLGCKNSWKYEHRFSESAPPLKLLKLQNTSKEKLGRVSMTREREALCCDSFTFILPFIFFFFATFFIVERFPLFHNSCIKYKYINKRTKIRVRQFSIDCRKSSGQCSSLTSLCDWSRKLVLPSQPITHKTKPWSSAFSRTSGSWPLFTLTSQWLLVLFSLILTSCCNFFSFVQATLN